MTMERKHQAANHQISAMICLYKNNVAAEVAEAVHSALNQDYAPTTLIVVYDGPVHRDVERVIGEVEKITKVKKVYHETCKGHGAARAAAVAACETDWLAIIDADDISMPERFSRTWNLINEFPETAVIGGGFVEFNQHDNNREIGHTVTFPETPSEIQSYLAKRSPIAQPTCCLRVAAVMAVGNYQSWYNNEDYHLWIRLVAQGYELRNTSEPLIWFRTSPETFKRRGGIRYWMNEAKLQLYSYRMGTTTFPQVLTGSFIRFVVQVLMTNSMRQAFYEKVLRKQ